MFILSIVVLLQENSLTVSACTTKLDVLFLLKYTNDCGEGRRQWLTGMG